MNKVKAATMYLGNPTFPFKRLVTLVEDERVDNPSVVRFVKRIRRIDFVPFQIFTKYAF